MKTVEFQDNSGNNLRVQYASDGDIRIYIQPERDDLPCIKLNKWQVNILISAIKDLLNEM